MGALHCMCGKGDYMNVVDSEGFLQLLNCCATIEHVQQLVKENVPNLHPISRHQILKKIFYIMNRTYLNYYS